MGIPVIDHFSYTLICNTKCIQQEIKQKLKKENNWTSNTQPNSSVQTIQTDENCEKRGTILLKWQRTQSILLHVNQFVYFFLCSNTLFSFSLILVVHWSCVMCVHSFTLNGTEFTTHHFDVVWKMLSNKLEKDAKIKIGNWAELIYNFVCYLQLANFTIFVIINQIMNDREKKINWNWI